MTLLTYYKVRELKNKMTNSFETMKYKVIAGIRALVYIPQIFPSRDWATLTPENIVPRMSVLNWRRT